MMLGSCFSAQHRAGFVTSLCGDVKSGLGESKVVYVNDLLLDTSVLRSTKRYCFFNRSFLFLQKNISHGLKHYVNKANLDSIACQNVTCTHGGECAHGAESDVLFQQCYLKEL